MDKIRIVALGGQDEFFKACTVVEINDDIFVVECGLKLPDVTKPGIDYIIPKTDYLVENKHRVKAYILTHGHDSVIGGLPYVYKNVPAPIYCSNITKAFLEMFCKHNRIDSSNLDFKVVDTSDDIEVAGHKIQLFSTCMNVAKSFGIAFNTDQGNIVFLANCVFDNNKDEGFILDLRKVAKISATNQTLVLLQDSIYADRPGYTNPNYKIIPSIQKTMKESPGRILIAVEAPDIYNIIAVLNEANRLRRKIIIYDESTQDIVDALLKTGCLKLKDNAFLPMSEVNRTPAPEVLVLITGFGEKLYHKIALLASNMHDERILQIEDSDTFIMATHAGNDVETAATNALNELYKNDCKIQSFNAKTFLVMHSSEEDLKTAISIFNPKYYIPIFGSLVKLFTNARIALGMNVGLNHTNVYVLDNGMIVEFTNGVAKILPTKLVTGSIFVDGKGVGDIASDVLEERKRFSDDGVIILAATISKSKRDIVLGPDIQTRGLVFVKENDALLREIDRVFRLNIKQELVKPNYSISYMEMTIKEQVFKAIRRSILKSPTIVPIITEIE